jgi:TRAP-type C4-dicarboxylate transport system permease small subunit
VVAVLHALDRLERAVIALLAGVALALACNAMLARYVFPGLSLDWTYEVITFVVIWAVFLAAARLIAEGGHIRVDVVLHAVPSGARRWFALLAALLGLGVAGLLTWSGVLVVVEAIRWGERSVSTLQIPLWIYYLCLPVGAALMALRLSLQIARLLREAPGATDDPPARVHG